MKARFVGIISGLLVISGCVTMSDQAVAVQVHSQISSVLDDCEKIGPVTATLGAFATHDALNAQLREATAALGGDSVAIVHTDEGLSQNTKHGIAFRCF